MIKKCCLCKKEYVGIGNTSDPLGKGLCCRVCSSYVVKARLAQARKGNAIILSNGVEADLKLERVKFIV